MSGFDDYKNKVIHGDCLEVMQKIPTDSVDLIIFDPPYNIGKAEWDKNIEDYVEWILKCFKEINRVMKVTGSLYMFHNRFVTLSKIILAVVKETNFDFNNFIIWNKRFNGCKNYGFLQGFISENGLRKYQLMAEYILFFTNRKGRGLSTDVNNEHNITIRSYFKSILDFTDHTKKKMIDRIGQAADHPFRYGSTQFCLPTQPTYNEIIEIIKECEIRKHIKFDIIPFDKLQLDFHKISIHDNIRYYFNNQKTLHSVWDYSMVVKDEKYHPTPKPLALLGQILLHSSKENDVVLDPCAGGGSTGIICKNLNRNYICIEKEKKYVDVMRERGLSIYGT